MRALFGWCEHTEDRAGLDSRSEIGLLPSVDELSSPQGHNKKLTEHGLRNSKCAPLHIPLTLAFELFPLDSTRFMNLTLSRFHMDSETLHWRVSNSV
jgi:hypothetical protein